jgi:hypothetical protein
MKKLRAWVTPITIGSFLLIGVTGLLMFFKVRGGLIVVAHEWLSPIFVVGACLHIWLNWGVVRANLSRARGIIIVGLFAALLAFTVQRGGRDRAGARPRPGGDRQKGGRAPASGSHLDRGRVDGTYAAAVA